MLSLKCDHPLIYDFPILSATVKAKLEDKFSQLIHKFNIWIFKRWSGALYISKFFPIHKRDGKLAFLKSLDCISKLLSPYLHIWSNYEGGGFLVCSHVTSEVKLAVSKKNCYYYNVQCM